MIVSDTFYHKTSLRCCEKKSYEKRSFYSNLNIKKIKLLHHYGQNRGRPCIMNFAVRLRTGAAGRAFAASGRFDFIRMNHHHRPNSGVTSGLEIVQQLFGFKLFTFL